MSTSTVVPVGFRCQKCYQQTIGLSEDSGQTAPCISCQHPNVVPEATADRVKAGQEIMNAMQSQPSAATTATADPYAAAANPYAAPPTDTNPYAAPTTYPMEVPREPGSIALATKTNRFLGRFIDGLISMIVAIVGMVVAIKFFPESPFALVVIYFPLLCLAIYQWCYMATEGKTIGKFLMKTKVIDAEGNVPGFVKGVVLRSWCIGLLACIPILGLIVSIGDPLSIFWSPANRCWHDKMAKTLVIQE